MIESASEAQAEEAAEIEPPAGRSWRWQAVAAVVGAGLLLTPFARPTWHAYKREAALRALFGATPAPERSIDPRVTGEFRYAPRPRVNRGVGEEKVETPEQMIIESKAQDVLDDTKGDPSPDAAHARGIAYLVQHDAPQAIAELIAATAARPNDAQAWSDLAAARYLARDYAGAHAAAERALAINPNLNEARFNRALATYRMKPADSIEEWNDYLKHDPTGPWADEAKQWQQEAKDLLP